MARNNFGRQVETQKKPMSVGLKISLLTFSVIFLLAAIVAPLAIFMSRTRVDQIRYGDFIYEVRENDGNVYYYIKEYVGEVTDDNATVVIPSSYNGSPVVGIMKNAFNGNVNSSVKNIKQLVFDTSFNGGVSHIDGGAFKYLYSLTSLTLPKTLTNIIYEQRAGAAFQYCNISGDVIIEDLAAYYKDDGENIIKTISNTAFANCEVGGAVIVCDSSGGIVPSDIMQSFGTLGAAELILESPVNIFTLGVNSFENWQKLTTLTVYTNSNYSEYQNKSGLSGPFNLGSSTNLKTINFKLGNDATLTSALTQKFSGAINIKTFNVCEGITKLGAGALSGFAEKFNGSNKYPGFQNVNVSSNASINVVSPLFAGGFIIDINVCDTTKLNSNVKIAFDNSASVSNAVKFVTSSDTLTTLGLNVVNLLKYPNRLNKLVVGYGITTISNNAFSRLFTNDALSASDYYELWFETKDDKTLINNNGGGGWLTASQLERLKVYGPITAHYAENVSNPSELDNAFVTDIYYQFNLSNGFYNKRYSYNDSTYLSDTDLQIRYVTLNDSMAANISLNDTESEAVSFTSGGNTIYGRAITVSAKIGDTQHLPTADNAIVLNKYIAGWFQDENGNFIYDAGEAYVAVNDNNSFVLQANTFNEEGDNVIKTITLFADWQDKPLVTVTFDPQFSEYFSEFNYSLNVNSALLYNPTATIFASAEYTVGTIEIGKDFNEGIVVNDMAVYHLPRILMSGYSFDSWNSAPDGSGERIVSESTLLNELVNVDGSGNKVLNLYAQWTPLVYTVNYYNIFTGAAISTSNNVYSSASPLIEPNYNNYESLQQNGYKAVGWNIYLNSILANVDLSVSANKVALPYGRDWLNEQEPTGTFMFDSDYATNFIALLEYYFNELKVAGENGSYYYQGDINPNCAMFTTPSIDVFVRYVENAYTFIYHNADDSETHQATPISYSESNRIQLEFDRTILPIIKPGYTFVGWAIEKSDGTLDSEIFYDCNQPGHAEITYSLAQILMRKFDVISLTPADLDTQNIHFYPIFTPNVIQIVLSNNGITPDAAGTQNIYYTFDNESYYTTYSSTSGFSGEIIDSIITPQKAGYTFNGYNMASDGSGETFINANGEIVNELYNSISANTTLFAQWAPHAYSVSVAINDKTYGYDIFYGDDYSEKVFVNAADVTDLLTISEVAAILRAQTPSGYVYDGLWTASMGGYQIYDKANNSTLNEGRWSLAGNDGDSYVLYPQNGALKYDITLNVSGSVNGEPISNNTGKISANIYYNGVNYGPTYRVEAGDEFSIGVTMGTGYIFTGFVADVNGMAVNVILPALDGNNLYTFDFDSAFINAYAETDSESGAVALTAIYRAMEFTLNYYDAATSTIIATETNKAYSSVFGSFPTDPVRANYVFAGWFANNSLTGDALKTSDSFDNSTATFVNILTENTIATVYAKWTPTYTLNYYDGSSVINTESDKVYGSEFGELPIPTKADYIFEGWYASSDFSGSKLTATSIFDSSSADFVSLGTAGTEARVYAKWIALTGNTYILTYITNGGDPITATIKEYGDTFDGDLVEPTRDGYNFEGWYAFADFSGLALTATDIFNTSNATFTDPARAGTTATIYAKWSAKVIEITLMASNGVTPDIVGTTNIFYEFNSAHYYLSYNSLTNSLDNEIALITLPTIAGYMLNGYNSASNGSGTMFIDYNGSIEVGLCSTIYENTTLYAQWTPAP